MSILKDLVKETAAGGAVGAGAMGVTSAQSIAGIRTPLGFNKSRGKKKKNKKKGGPVGNIYSFKFVEGMNFSQFLREVDDSDFDASDVIAKLKNSEQEAEDAGEDTTAFALEDENGQLVKVWVPDDQADDFESALEQALSQGDEDNDDENDQKEIAEVIWNLRKDFDIVNVEWGGDLPQDEEQEISTPPAEGGKLPGETGAELHGDEGGEGGEGGVEEVDPASLEGGEGEGGDMEAEPGEADELGGEDDTKSTLQSVIDMMKADAEARMADANARAAEAKAREAETSMNQAKEKVKQEEEILDMEAYYDKQKEEKGEADRLAKLAKYKHDLASERGVGPSDAEATPDIEVDKDVDVNVEPQMPAEQEDNEWTYRDYGGHGGGTHVSKADLGDLILKALRRR